MNYCNRTITPAVQNVLVRDCPAVTLGRERSVGSKTSQALATCCSSKTRTLFKPGLRPECCLVLELCQSSPYQQRGKFTHPSFFLASRLSLISSLSLSLYSLTYFSALLKISTRLARLWRLATRLALARAAATSAWRLRRFRIVSGTAGSFLSGMILLRERTANL